jgi:hypothetical protein
MENLKPSWRKVLSWLTEPILSSYSHFIVLFALQTLLGIIGLQLMSPNSSSYAYLSCTIGIMIYNFLSIYIVFLVCKQLGKLGGNTEYLSWYPLLFVIGKCDSFGIYPSNAKS